MRTVRQAQMVLPGTRARVYEVDLVELTAEREERFVVNFRYGWQGSTLEEGTRTPDPVSEATAVRLFDSVITARRNQGYRLAGEAAPEPKAPPATPVATGAGPRDVVFARRLKTFDGLGDIAAASLLRRIGELRLTSLCSEVCAAARAVMAEGNRIVALRTLPYALHRTDDGRGEAAAVLDDLAAVTDVPVSETASVLRAFRNRTYAPGWDAAPAVLRSATGLPDASAREAAVISYFQAATTTRVRRGEGPDREAMGALCLMYARGPYDPLARALLLAALHQIPLAPPLFVGIRRILQVAEAVDDADVLAILNQRFDDEPSRIMLGWQRDGQRRRAFVDGAQVAVREEAAKPNARLAYTRETRSYMRRRNWRTMRRLAAIGDPAYVRLASAVLMTLDDARALEAENAEGNELKQAEAGRRRRRRGENPLLPPFADRFAAHHIMHGAGPRLAPSQTSLRWRFNPGLAGGTSRREEPFAELWDGNGAALWTLVREARAAIVVGFATRALMPNQAFADTLATSDIAALMSNWAPHAERLQLALALAERRIAKEGLKPELAIALMRNPDRGGALIKLYLAARPEIIANDADLFAAMLLGCAVGNHVWFDPLAEQATKLASTEVRQGVLARVLASLEADPWPAIEAKRASLLAAQLAQLFPAEIAALDGEVIRRLAGTRVETSMIVAAHLAAVRPDGASLVDIGALAQSANPDLRAAGIAVFAQRPIDDLVHDLDAVAAFLAAEAKEPRAAARPVAERIGHERPEAARVLAEKLLPALYRQEEHEGLREDVLAVLSMELRGGVIALGSETVWALLRARSEPARRLGASVLEAMDAKAFSIRQIARIGCNDQVAARAWSHAQLHARIAEVRAAPEEAFALLDSEFVDAREAGYALFRDELTPEDWSPTALVALCDSITEPAQRFGREMIGRVFEAKNAEFLLARLSEHPAAGFRLLVARLMRDYVKDDAQRLQRLAPTIETTLLQVRRSRAAKDQVLAFIEEQIGSKVSRDNAAAEAIAILAPVLERTVATCAVEDRARTLSMLTQIKARYPELAPKAQILPREARG